MQIKTLNNKSLKLTNDGNLTFLFIGVGSAFTKKMNQTNLLIIKGDDHLLIDCGTKCSTAFLNLGIPITDIENYFITHSHADHIGGIEEAALMARYVSKKKLTMIINETYQKILWDMSLKGGIAYNEEKAGNILSFTDFFNPIRPKKLKEFKRETFHAKMNSIDVKFMRTKHIPDSSDTWESSFWSCGIIIDDRVLFTSDTKYDPELITEYDSKFNFEHIFHDCQLFTGGVHASLDELNQLPSDIKKKICLTHYGDNWESFTQKVKDYGFKGFAKEKTYYIFN